MDDSSKLEEVLFLLKEMKLTKLSHEEIAFLRQLIKKEKEEAEIRKAIKTKLATGSIWAIVSSVALSCGYTLYQWVLNGLP